MPANLAHHGDVRERPGQLVPQLRSFDPHALDQPFLPEHLDHAETDCARHGRPIPRMPVGELARAVGERLVNVVTADDASDGCVTGAKTFGRGDDVGHQRQLVGGEPVAGPAHASDHLVVEDEKSVLVPALSKPFPEELGRRIRWQRGGGDRLAEVSRYGLRPNLLQHFVESRKRRLAGGVESPGARRDVMVSCEIRPERALQPWPSGERERRHRWPVIGLGRGDHVPALRVASLDVVAARHL